MAHDPRQQRMDALDAERATIARERQAARNADLEAWRRKTLTDAGIEPHVADILLSWRVDVHTAASYARQGATMKQLLTILQPIDRPAAAEGS